MNSKIPEKYRDSYYVGQEFIEDPVKIDSFIEAVFIFSALLEDFDFFLNKIKINVKHTGSGFIVSFNQKISNELFNSVKKDHRGDRFILATISKFLPKINQEVLNQRYRKGHVLAKTFSLFDIYKVTVTRKDTGEKIYLSWPKAISSFPPSEQLAKENDEIFIRDWVDAMHVYFDNNFDECIRKIVTSVENFFRFKKFKVRKKFSFFRSRKFISIIKQNIYGKDFARKVISSNLIFIYKIRCKIIHHKFRLNYKNAWFCKKAIGTLFYLYQLFSKSQSMVDFVFSLWQQFSLVDSAYCHIETLEEIERGIQEIKENCEVDNIIETSEDLDTLMFKRLKISDKEKQVALRQK